jgi:HPt (histidine-containing phosphotransfer) domain-containing protein
MIDWSKFKMYLGEYDQSVVVELIEMFIRDVPEKIANLEKHVSARDFSAISFDAHPLKTNCATLGGTDAAEHARNLEMMGKNQIEDGLDDELAALKALLILMVAELEAYVKEQAG